MLSTNVAEKSEARVALTYLTNLLCYYSNRDKGIYSLCDVTDTKPLYSFRLNSLAVCPTCFAFR